MNTLSQAFNNLKGDRFIWLIFMFLAFASILAVYSSIGSMAYQQRGGNTEFYLLQHLLYLGFGMGLMIVCSRMHYMNFSKLAPILIIVAIFLLIYTLIFGLEINDAKRWLEIPMLDKTVQTSDFAKIALIIFLARELAKRQNNIKDFKYAFLPIILPVGLVCMLIGSEDLSTAALLFATCFLMMMVGRVSLKYMGLTIMVGIILLSLLVLIGTAFPEYVRLETWMSRVNEFMTDPNGGYQIQNSKIAIANGGIFGEGPGNSMQRNYLPFPYADFIYAIICEEYGILGSGIILFLYLWLLLRCTAIVTKCPKSFGALLAMGLGLNIVIQAFANMAVSVHLVPVTGLTLPIISMGGTSLVLTCVAIGIILSVSRYVEDYKTEQKVPLAI